MELKYKGMTARYINYGATSFLPVRSHVPFGAGRRQTTPAYRQAGNRHVSRPTAINVCTGALTSVAEAANYLTRVIHDDINRMKKNVPGSFCNSTLCGLFESVEIRFKFSRSAKKENVKVNIEVFHLPLLPVSTAPLPSTSR